MRVLLTNDDGYDAPGIRALWDALRTLGDDLDLSIIAPAEAHSGKGHALSPSVRCRTAHLANVGDVLVVDGTPGDCVRIGVALPGRSRPDMVISGINHGSNLGVDLYYSGTVAAAREAAILRIPAIAISQHVRRECPDDWPRTVRQAAAILDALLGFHERPPSNHHPIAEATRRAVEPLRPSEPPMPAGFWNVNIPGIQTGRQPPDVRLVPVSTDALVIRYDHRIDDSVHSLTYTGPYHERIAAPDTDVATVFGGSIAISRIPI